MTIIQMRTVLAEARIATGNYRELRGKRIKGAWSLSGLPGVVARAKEAAFWLALAACTLFLMSDFANAQQLKAQAGSNAEVQQLRDYAASLEKALAACLGESDGVLVIGGEWHLCRAVPIGRIAP